MRIHSFEVDHCFCKVQNLLSQIRSFITRQFHRFGNSSCFIIHQRHKFLPILERILLKLKHAFNRPVYVPELCTRCGPIVTTDLRGVYTTEQKWHGPDKNWNGSNSFYKETVNFYPFRDGSIGAYGPVAERIKVHCFFVKTVGTFQFLPGPCHFCSFV